MTKFRTPFDWEIPEQPRHSGGFAYLFGAALLRCCKAWEADYSKIDPESLIPYEGSAHYPGLCPRAPERSN